MPTTITTESGRTKVLPDTLELHRVAGLDREGRIVVDDSDARNAEPSVVAGHTIAPFMFGLTLCCNASDKGVESGVVCRGCYGETDVGNYLYREPDGSFPELDPIASSTATEGAPMPKPATVEEVPFPKGLASVEVGMIVEFEPFYLDRPSDRPLLNKPFRVTKVNPKSIAVEDENGRVVKTASYMLKATDRPFTKSDVELPTLGSLVRLRGKDGLFAVVAVKLDKFNVAKVGGDDGKYFRGVTVAHLTVVDPAEVLK